jgi:signal transduction histidine kinase
MPSAARPVVGHPIETTSSQRVRKASLHLLDEPISFALGMSGSGRPVYSAAMQVSRERWRSVAIDVGPVVVLALVSVLTAGREHPRDALTHLLVITPLLVRRAWPFAIFALVAFLAVVTAAHTSTPLVQVGAVALASYSTGDGSSDRTRTAMGVVSVAALMTLGILAQDADPLQSLVLPFAIVMPSWLVGDTVRARRTESRERAAAAERALRETEERLRSAAAEERRHMARELHDVVAHGVSVMLIQTGAARQVVETSPDRATDSLLTVEATGREVMAELRRMLGVLNDDGEAAGVAPQPGIDQLAPLVERVRAAGLPAELEITGTPRPLPTSLDVTVYRIVQEALTNALRYARRAATSVHIAYEPEQLRVEVLDDGPSAELDSVEGSGRGLVGMQQRASLVGGRFEAGPRLGGGYAVRAWLPVEPEQV